MSDTSAALRAQVDAIIQREGVRLSPEEYERMVTVYTELQEQLAALRAPEFGEAEPAVVYSAV